MSAPSNTNQKQICTFETLTSIIHEVHRLEELLDIYPFPKRIHTAKYAINSEYLLNI